ncbi:hypothetical protein Bhyg_08918 [Pseudolycoriella hygida]|uniref:Uncharacterized protein n=1 Tax=Pseudolycoriella hygida TaxID=35572 RepID=A0A9Q0N5I7_9DIPT|nr:hypothetical protein Bhyg_08918 [Pseudolycoriella hygida]
MKALIVFVTIFVLSFNSPMADGKEVRLHRTPAQMVMDNISKEDRPSFVAYHLSIALHARHRNDVEFKPRVDTIPREKREEFAQIHTPPNFSFNLLDWTELELVPYKNGHGIQSEPFDETAKVSTVCFPNGCVYANDAGELCCPF